MTKVRLEAFSDGVIAILITIMILELPAPHGEDAPLPTAVYGVVLLMPAVAWTILQGRILALHGPDSKLAQAVGADVKGKASLAMYAAAVPLAFVEPWISAALYIVVALMWLVPDPRIEQRLR